jgi:hypothetical protein
VAGWYRAAFKERTWHRVLLAERLRRLLLLPHLSPPTTMPSAGPPTSELPRPAPNEWSRRFVHAHNSERGAEALPPTAVDPTSTAVDPTRDRRLDGEGRAALIAFGRELCAKDRAARDGMAAAQAAQPRAVDDALAAADTSAWSLDPRSADASSADAPRPVAPVAPSPAAPSSATAPSPQGFKLKLTRRDRRTLRSRRARHAGAHGEILRALPVVNEREAALAALDGWLSRMADHVPAAPGIEPASEAPL